MIQSPQNYYQPQPQPVYYQPQQAQPQPQPQYNAVKIDIIEPKVNTPGSQLSNYNYPAAPMYNYQPAPYYNYPQAEAQPAPGYAYSQAQPAPGYAYPQAQASATATATAQPMPAQPMPVPPPPQVINNQYVVPPSPVITQPTPEQATVAIQQQAAASAPPPAQAAQTMDVAGLTSKIKTGNAEEVGSTIENIALVAQNNPAEAVQLLDTNLMESLLGVIGKETAGLEGPTPKQIEMRQQLMAGKTLPEADLAEAQKVSPLEVDERNKQYALFTVAILQNLLVNELQKTNNTTPDIKDLPGMEQIVLTIKDNQSPMLRASALAALAYNARPEYKPVMKEIFELSKNDADENVQKVAADGLSRLEQIK